MIRLKVIKSTALSIFIFVLSLLLPLTSIAQQVTTSDRVESGVFIRDAASSSGAKIGVLGKGEKLKYIESVPRWHKVQLNDGREGYVSKSWTVLIESPETSDSIPFKVHFVDVGNGDAIIIDMGDKEIVIDGGDPYDVLADYVRKTGIIDDPIELVIETHSDGDHWHGLATLLGTKKGLNKPYSALEFWEPGYNRDCEADDKNAKKDYLAFIKDAKNKIPVNGFKRPLENFYTPAVVSNSPQTITLDSIPNAKITLLHSDSNPTGSDCPYKINNASIVILMEIDGIKFLFSGDANGKERGDSPTVEAKYVEKLLLNLEKDHPGLLKVDVLKVPHHGSETANTQKYIDAVNPKYAIISANTRNSLPKKTVVTRYTKGTSEVLRTDAHREKNIDHIICSKRNGNAYCNYANDYDQ